MSDPVWQSWEDGRVERAYARRQELLNYNFTCQEEEFMYRNSRPSVPVPAVGCIVHSNNSGYGDCSEDNWIVIDVERTIKTDAPKALILRQVHGIDIGRGRADEMPEHPGKAAVSREQTPLRLTLAWEFDKEKKQWEASWKERDVKAKWWCNDHFEIGVYRPSKMGIDK
jgi:hypothetical protein